MGQRQESETLTDPEERADLPAISRRHRPTSEIRLPEAQGASVPAVPVAKGALSDELRIALWDIIHASLFAPSDAFDRWTSGVTGRPAVRRIWSAAPISGEPGLIPEDIAELLEGWFSLVEPCDVYVFLDSVLTSLEPTKQAAFMAACNAALERSQSAHRFVLHHLVPIASRSDITAIERALVACQRVGAAAAEPAARLRDAIARLAHKPTPDRRGAIQEAVRAVEAAAFALTGERHLSLDDALEDLERRHLVDGPLKAAYGGLFTYASPTRKTTADDARLIVVMCAGFLTHLTSKMR